jgi:hypothetical protein
MLNVFAHTLKVHLASWNVHGDKTNEPACLKKHLGELFTMFPCLKLLTGDAIFTQRPLLEAIQEYHRDYLFQVKENQPKLLKKMKAVFADAPKQEPNDHRVTEHGNNRKNRRVNKKGGCRSSHTLDKEVGGRVCPGNVGHSELPILDSS